MKRISLLLTLLFAAVFSVLAQQLYIEGGKSISSFVYKDSEGKTLDNLHSTDNFFLSIGFRRNIFIKNLFLNVSGNYNTYGASGSDKDLDNFYDWNLNYLGLDLGLDYYLYKKGKLGFYLKGGVSAEFLVQGKQTINDQVYNLREEKDFDSPFYFFRGGVGAQYAASEKLTVFTQYLYGKGAQFKNHQGNLKIHEHRFGIGLFINISSSQPAVVPVTPVLPSNLDEIKRRLDTQSQKINELEKNQRMVDSLRKVVADKEGEIKAIKESIAHALQPYDGSELTINEIAGKIYVTMGSDLIFNSGSSKINAEGRKAITDLGNELAKNPGMNILIEGHTDNVPFKNTRMSNWDLSVKRATAVVELLRENQQINPESLTAAGRGEYDPIAPNTTPEGRAKNRRIEIIISPKLDELSDLINN